jgi:hypothetical protein
LLSKLRNVKDGRLKSERLRARSWAIGREGCSLSAVAGLLDEYLEQLFGSFKLPLYG